MTNGCIDPAVDTPAILVVDDEPASLRAVRRTLAAMGEIITVTTAAEALACLATRPVSVLVVDQRMPHMLGTEVLARCSCSHPDVVRILLTGYTDVDTLIAAINAGHVYAYLTKPWEPGELRLVVRRALEHHAAERDRRRLLREVGEACARAERQAAQRARLLAVAAHEVGTPVHVVANALAFVAYEPLGPAARHWVDVARRGTKWLGRCVTQLSHGGRWLAGAPRLTGCAVNLGTVVTGTAAEFASVCATRGLHLAVDVEDTLPPVWGDARWLRRAIGNLVTNAVRCTPDEGSIRLTATAAGDCVEVSVADTGIGIEASRFADLFEPFAGVHGDVDLHTSGAFDFGARGLGLGLAITRSIVEAHGGRLNVDSTCGTGSRFSFTVPVATRRDGSDQRSPDVAPDDGTARTAAVRSDEGTIDECRGGPTPQRENRPSLNEE